MAAKNTALLKIEEHQRQIEQLKHEAVTELKQQLLEARRAVAALEEDMAQLTGRASTSAPEPRARRTRRPGLSADEMKAQLLKIMATEGKMGLNAKQIAEHMNQDAMRVRKFIKDNPKLLKRQGAGPGTKFFTPMRPAQEAA